MLIEIIVKMLFIVLVMMGALPARSSPGSSASRRPSCRTGSARTAPTSFGIRAIGLLHPAADVLKLLTKEDVVPRGANRVLHLLAPVISIVPAIVTLAVIPFGGRYQFGDTTLNLVVADIDWGMLYVLAVGSIATYGAVIAGWASNNNWSLLGSMRASSQMISYEVTMGLSLVGLFMVFGTLRLTGDGRRPGHHVPPARLPRARRPGRRQLPAWLDWIRLPAWGVFLQPLGFILFLTCIMAENKRPPFDAPEGESEIIAGYHMEYSGMRFGLFYTAEFLEVPVIGALVATLFFGGWAIPWLSQETIIGGVTGVFGAGFATGLCLIVHVLTFLLKVVIMIWVQMLIRWTLPRFRYDQVMDLCWKTILPLSIANVFVTGGVILLVEGLR